MPFGILLCLFAFWLGAAGLFVPVLALWALMGIIGLFIPHHTYPKRPFG